ncbi:MAG: 4Fe-4S binding protein, partial [Desulfobacterales bacterium]|nr:4Fe-4S binding protein [Desulfobacterales bacterium]
MYSKILILRFPKTEVQKPVVCNLAKNFDLNFNILNATIYSGKEGMMVLELWGNKKIFKQGVQYLKDQGVIVENAAQAIERDLEKCVHCGACTAVCPTGALSVQRPE